MGLLFEPFQRGTLQAKNRFVRSSTYEGRADGDGGVTPELLDFYAPLAQGNIGTIVTGYLYVSQDGKPSRQTTGIHEDQLIPGLERLARVIKQDDSLAVFQLVHAGGQTMKGFSGSKPRAPSADRRTPILLSKASALRLDEMAGVVSDFARAARRAEEAGADGVQIHAAHGYLLSEFLSPFFNHRDDAYGGSVENRYRLVGEVVRAVRDAVGPDFLVLAKINIDDGTPQPGVTPEMAASYASHLVADGVDAVEVSAGSTFWAPFVMCRGEAHCEDFTRPLPRIVQPLGTRQARRSRQPSFTEAYNQEGAAVVKGAMGGAPLAVVGGMRTLPVMESCVTSGAADLISLSRPLIREPGFLHDLEADPSRTPRCVSCSRCLAGAFNALPTRCYTKGLPA